MLNPCKGWILTVGRMQLDLNILDYTFKEMFFTDYSEMKSYKNYVETNEREQSVHQTIATEKVVW